MANTIYKGTGALASGDCHSVKWAGQTKGGKKIFIRLPKAYNLGNIEWTMKEKDDIVSGVVFTALYSNTNATATSTEEPYEIEVEDGVTAGAGEIILGAGAVYIDDVLIGLTRGGSAFNITREYRRINADGDRGPVEGRVVMETSEATLTVNALQLLTNLTKLYPAMGN